MSAKIIDGRVIASGFQNDLIEKINALAEKNIYPGLAVVLAGENPASISYVTAKERACEKVGIYSRDIRLPGTTSQEQLLEIIAELNVDSRIDGILVQLPLPAGMDEEIIIGAIAPEKDVDGFHPVNLGCLLLNRECFIPCTPHAVIKMLEASGTIIDGSDIVIVGRSRIVGAPLANLLFRKAPGGNGTVTVCHTGTRDLAGKVKRSDIVIVATGHRNTVTADMIKKGATVIDVGINRIEDASKKRGFRLVGDIDFDAVKEIAGAVSPVPGGVGPMTITMLLWNTVASAQRADVNRS